jgi:hypothetical protein
MDLPRKFCRFLDGIDSYYRRIDNALVLQKRALELRRWDLEPFVLDKFLLPVDNSIESFAVSDTDVACLEPSVGRDGVRRRLRIVDISLRVMSSSDACETRCPRRMSTKAYLHDSRATNPQLASFTFLRVFVCIGDESCFQVGKKLPWSGKIASRRAMLLENMLTDTAHLPQSMCFGK